MELETDHKDNPPWKKLIKLKYGLEVGEWFSEDPKGSFGVGLWKDIRKEGQQTKHDCKLVLGNGGRIRFWEDSGMGRILFATYSQPFMQLLHQKEK